MKKLMVIILLGLTCLTMYFVVLWEPSVDVVKNEEVVKENKIETDESDKEINDKEIIQNEKEEKKNEKEEKERLEKELEEKEAKEKEENKKKILNFGKNLREEDRKIIDKKIGTLSTVDLMKVEEFLSEGNLKEAMNLMKLRMLEEDWKHVNEVFGKYK
ncbi:MAG: hypothetical protein ACRC28_04940 [Clostridium sp.]|uniref:hypothetical protein n=1 Tax=Clostridium sp. TaxID=1506 RepID=UPI003F2E3F90